jgi:hypothetical protein
VRERRRERAGSGKTTTGAAPIAPDVDLDELSRTFLIQGARAQYRSIGHVVSEVVTRRTKGGICHASGTDNATAQDEGIRNDAHRNPPAESISRAATLLGMAPGLAPRMDRSTRVATRPLPIEWSPTTSYDEG